MPAPQVIFLMTDSQRRDMIGAYDTSMFQTPHLDRLAAEGIRFDAAYCNSPVCTPDRGALFTGMPPHQNGAWANRIAFHENTLTIGQRLSDAGIRTAFTGKWHLDGSDYFGTGNAGSRRPRLPLGSFPTSTSSPSVAPLTADTSSSSTSSTGTSFTT